jgi:hypothetical protein
MSAATPHPPKQSSEIELLALFDLVSWFKQEVEAILVEREFLSFWGRLHGDVIFIVIRFCPDRDLQ